MKKNKIVLFVLALILLAGIIMICVKGFNVSLSLRAHDTLKFVFDTKFNMNDITKICDDVFKDKEYKVETVEVFSDAVYIISPTISLDEEKALLEKLDNLYKTEETPEVAETAPEETPETPEATTPETEGQTETSEDPGAAGSATAENTEQSILDKLTVGDKYDFYHDSKVRISDMVYPYLIPSGICALIIVLYIGIKYRKLGNVFVTVLKTLVEMLVCFLTIVSIIAICRIPFTTALIPIVILLVLVCLCIRLLFYERELENL